jgi:hypothetical protein
MRALNHRQTTGLTDILQPMRVAASLTKLPHQ